MSDEKCFYVCTVFVILGIVAAISWIITYAIYESYDVDKAAIEAGLEQGVLPGYSRWFWVERRSREFPEKQGTGDRG